MAQRLPPPTNQRWLPSVEQRTSARNKAHVARRAQAPRNLKGRRPPLISPPTAPAWRDSRIGMAQQRNAMLR
eukprot:1096774-Alexandrium_andersonii.AAC.1